MMQDTHRRPLMVLAWAMFGTCPDHSRKETATEAGKDSL
jgi:hypothetical protein